MHPERNIAMELHSLSNMNMRYMDNCSHKQYVDSITGTNGWIIGYLAHNCEKDIFQRDLEQTFGITRSTVSKVLNLMEQKGLIQRTAVYYDARLKKITLTPKSLELMEFMHEDNEKLENILTNGFTSDEKAVLTEYISRMKINMKEALSANGVDISRMPCPKEEEE